MVELEEKQQKRLKRAKEKSNEGEGVVDSMMQSLKIGNFSKRRLDAPPLPPRDK